MSNQQACPDLKILHAVITDIDALSQHALSEIVSAADLLLQWMESPESYQRLNVIADVLTLISYRAQETLETIGHEAESVGCGYVDIDSQRRLEAWEKFRAGGHHA
ncbi:hypothetical protein [Serratia fonticola]